MAEDLLFYAKKGSKAFIDGKKDAFVLYRKVEANRQVHILVLQESNGDWLEVSDIETSYYT